MGGCVGVRWGQEGRGRGRTAVWRGAPRRSKSKSKHAHKKGLLIQ